ncbi:DUF89 domain-containing protein [Actinomycetota bacterium]
MKTNLKCMPCFVRQAFSALEIAGADEKQSTETLRELFKILADIDFDDTPAANANDVYKIVARVTGIKDPYKDVKRKYNAAALKLYPKLEEIVKEADDGLHAAAKIAVAGNVIDYGIHIIDGRKVDLDSVIAEVKNIPLAIDDFNYFVKELKKTDKILYIADNSGEIVFDKVFISELAALGKKVILAVKSGPILNDATIEDAREAGLDNIAQIIETGCDCIGLDFRTCTKEFLKEFESAGIIISKGQGNVESLDGVKGKKIYFLLKAKCEIMARELGVEYLDIVFKRSDHA